MRHEEANFQICAVRMLRMAGHFVFAVPNGGSRNLREAVNLKAQGVLAGVSDLILLLPNRKVYFIELKNPNGKGRQSPAQREFEENVRAMGHEYLIWDKWQQVEDFINAHRAEIGNFLAVGGTNND